MNMTLFYIYMFILGSIFASFFGVIICRVPNNLSIVKPGSHCDNCNHILKWYENIPIFSYIFLKGKCSKCSHKLDKFYFIYEIIGGLSLLLVGIVCGITIKCLFVSLISLMLLLIAGYDYKTHYVLDDCLYLLAIFCLSYFLYRVFILKMPFYQYLISFFFCLAFFVLTRTIMTRILKREAMGIGDVYLSCIMSIIFEPFELILAILIASVVGSIIAIISIKLNKSDEDKEIAFCPYLCLGFYIILLFGNKLSYLLLG